VDELGHDTRCRPLQAFPDAAYPVPEIMKIHLKTLLCTILLMLLCVSAHARLIIGVAATSPFATAAQTDLDRFGAVLSQNTGTDVELRTFHDEETLSSWLFRFQQLDAVLVPTGFIAHYPAGSVQRLVDLHDRSEKLLLLVTRSNLAAGNADQLRQAFLKLDPAAAAMRALSFSGVTLPGQKLKRQHAAKARSERKSVTPSAPERTAQAEPTQEPAPIKRVVTARTSVKAPKAEPLATTPQPSASQQPEASTPATADDKTSAATSGSADNGEAGGQGASRSEAKGVDSGEPALEPTPATATPPPSSAAETPAPAETAQAQAPAAATQKPSDKPTSARLTLFVVLLLSLSILVKLVLIGLRRQRGRAAQRALQETPDFSQKLFEAAEPAGATSTGAPAEAATAAEADDSVVEVGRLGPGKVPQLLKRCADMPRPVVLQVVKGQCDKRVFFVGGQVAGGLTQDSSSADTKERWNKLGSLLVREGLLNEEGRASGVSRTEQEPTLRFGEALLKLGLVSLDDLRKALTRQAKATVFSLILFPEGRYEIIADHDTLPPEESISLEVSTLLREAAQHRNEWTAIRQALPNLNKALSFRADGQQKLARVGLSRQQQETLALVDGARTINDICTTSQMMDYEIYRLLYLMVKAGVLE
jgi:hypothetical protein